MYYCYIKRANCKTIYSKILFLLKTYIYISINTYINIEKNQDDINFTVIVLEGCIWRYKMDINFLYS